ALPAGERLSLVVASLDAAEAQHLRTEQGLAAYALAACFLGLGFEAGSAPLRSLLASPMPEVRRVHALNEWVRATLGDPSNPGRADEALQQSLQRTAAWGDGAAVVAKERAHGLG
ncbi:MAG: hypothetical protein C0505_16545, partial [Leptothrix sp. (in: Bacteria)]|nr:hypothetical protein [Leptothrix sp. (in: b-proteobacteria)]